MVFAVASSQRWIFDETPQTANVVIVGLALAGLRPVQIFKYMYFVRTVSWVPSWCEVV